MAHLSEQATNTMLAIGLNKISVYKNRNRNHGPCDEDTFLHDEKLVNKILDHLGCNPSWMQPNSKALAPCKSLNQTRAAMSYLSVQNNPSKFNQFIPEPCEHTEHSFQVEDKIVKDNDHVGTQKGFNISLNIQLEIR